MEPSPRDEAFQKEDRLDKMKKQKKTKKKKNSPPVPHLLQAQQAPALPYAKVLGRRGTGSYAAPSPEPTTHNVACVPMFLKVIDVMTETKWRYKMHVIFNTIIDFQIFWLNTFFSVGRILAGLLGKLVR